MIRANKRSVRYPFVKDVGSRYGSAKRPEVGPGGILDAAAALFRRRSYSAVSLRAIAQAAGIKAGTIYHHFTSAQRTRPWPRSSTRASSRCMKR